ncbi:MAG: Imm10 family immunity protein [Pirellulaceae bacterium]
MNSKSFTSKCVTFQEVDGVVMVGFADDEFNTNQYVLLQRTLQPDEHDRSLGWDIVHLQVDSPDQSGYDSIKNIRVTLSGIRIELTSEALSVFNCSDVDIAFDIDGDRYSDLLAQLKHVVDECTPLTV